MVGGHFDIQSAPGKGTAIHARIPSGKAAPAGTLTESAAARLESL
jgi:chemotaxis protein histidine kinase CheA